MKNTQTVTDINEWKINKRKQREMAFDETDILGGKAIILMNDFGKHKDRNNVQVERVVFMHRTHENGRFIHFHCALKSVGNKEAFKIAINKVWRKYVYNGLDVHFEKVGTGFGIYVLHEQKNWNGIKLKGSGTGKHKGKQLATDTNDGNWLHDLQHIDNETSYYIRQQQALDKHTNSRLSKLFCNETKLVEVKRFFKQKQWNTLSDTELNSAIALNIQPPKLS